LQTQFQGIKCFSAGLNALKHTLFYLLKARNGFKWAIIRTICPIGLGNQKFFELFLEILLDALNQLAGEQNFL